MRRSSHEYRSKTVKYNGSTYKRAGAVVFVRSRLRLFYICTSFPVAFCATDVSNVEVSWRFLGNFAFNLRRRWTGAARLVSLGTS